MTSTAVAEKPKTGSENYSGLVAEVGSVSARQSPRCRPDIANVTAYERRRKGPEIVNRIVNGYLTQLALYHASR